MRALVFSTEGQFAAPVLTAAFRSRDWEVIEPADELELLAIVHDGEPDLIAVQTLQHRPAMLSLARRLRQADRHAALVFVVPVCDDDLALAALRAGISDLLTESSSDEEVGASLARLSRGAPPPAARAALRGGERLVGRSKAIEDLRRTIQRVAACDSNVLITGETGTGKELAAELIHMNSRRADRVFLPINCAAIPEGLLESELFGYERGAFTGAHAAREGKLQHARGGTLFLDEIGDMTLCAQAKILRAIESRRVQRLGANRDIPLDIRIIAATNQNPEQLTSQQKFRQDLYFRLNVARIHLPPLRDHAEDVPVLVEHLLSELAPKMDRAVRDVDGGYLDALIRYNWPGNVRELRNIIESTLVFCGSPRVTARDLPPYLRSLFASEVEKHHSERERILSALRSTGWNRNETARLLATSRMTLYRKMVRHHLFDQQDEDQRGCNIGAHA